MAVSKKARLLAVERAVVEDVNAPILPDDGGEAAPARKKKRQPVAVLAEHASGRFVRRICGR